MRGKKGFWALEEVGKIILILAAFFILAAFMYKLFAILQQESIEQACRASVITRVDVRDAVRNLPISNNIFPINCKTQDVVVPTEDLPRRATDQDRRDNVMEALADNMANCWWMFANGMYGSLLTSGDQKNYGACSVCYSVYVEPMVDDNGKPLTIKTSDFQNYLQTHAYKPGLLKGGEATIGGLDVFTFTPQHVAESSRTSRQMTADRLLASQKHLDGGVADFSDIFSNDENTKFAIQGIATTLSNYKVLEEAFIILPSLPEETYTKRSSLPVEILTDWNIGTPGKNNGIAFIFDMNSGKLFYASQSGADALLPRAVIKNIFDTSTKEDFDTNNPGAALLAFAQAIQDYIKDDNSAADKPTFQKAQSLIAFQNTYAAYLTGGVQAPIGITYSGSYSGLESQGAVALSAIGDTIKPGERYAIVFIAAHWPERGFGQAIQWTKEQFGAAKEQPNMIAVVPHESLFQNNEALCTVNTGDG